MKLFSGEFFSCPVQEEDYGVGRRRMCESVSLGLSGGPG